MGILSGCEGTEMHDGTRVLLCRGCEGPTKPASHAFWYVAIGKGCHTEGTSRLLCGPAPQQADPVSGNIRCKTVDKNAEVLLPPQVA